MEKEITVSILGTRHRGADAYGKGVMEMPNRFKIVSLCDLDRDKLNKYKKLFGVSDENAFDNDDAFFAKKQSNVLVIATGDDSHVAMAKRTFGCSIRRLSFIVVRRYKEYD